MSELLSSVTGGGGSGFNSDGIVYTSIATGQTGSLISLPEVSGKVYRIFLLATGTSSQQTGISLITNGVTIESEKTLVDNTSPSADIEIEFGVFRNYTASTSTTPTRRMYDIVECASFEVTKNPGNTTQAIDLSYEIGSYL